MVYEMNDLEWASGILAVTPQDRIRLLATVLMYLLILLVVVVFGWSAIWIIGRRWRESLTRTKKKTVDHHDVWTQHKLPEELRKAYMEPDSDESRPDDDEAAGG